jgi:hypothetical protein
MRWASVEVEFVGPDGIPDLFNVSSVECTVDPGWKMNPTNRNA